MAASSLCDGVDLARQMEALFHRLWQEKRLRSDGAGLPG
jgi:predicted O-linked N-acetylglucosamine transferase (SPINDLY family)